MKYCVYVVAILGQVKEIIVLGRLKAELILKKAYCL